MKNKMIPKTLGIFLSFGLVASAFGQLEENGPIGFYTSVNSAGDTPIAVVETGILTYDFAPEGELLATMTVNPAQSEYVFGTPVTITGLTQNGNLVRALQYRSHFSDGSRSATVTLAGSTIDLTANGNTHVRPIIGRLYEYATFNVASVIAPDNAVDYEADNLGATGSVPLGVMNKIIAEKAPMGLAGVVDFENAQIGPNHATGNLETYVPGTDISIRHIRAVLSNDNEITINPNKDNNYVEAGGDNLATVDGPGPVRDASSGYVLDGIPEQDVTINHNPSGRVPTSGIAGLGNATTFAFDFSASDKVVMSGIVYGSRANFQHGNPDKIDKLWAKVTYSDGSTSDTLSSKNLQDVAGLYDNFFGFEAPAGLYITQIHVWCRGQNARAFTIVDDLAFVLEGDALDTYEISATSNNAARGTVTGGGSITSGQTATLTATPEDGFVFLGWTYTDGPSANIFSTATSVEVVANGSKTIQGLFVEPGVAAFTDNTNAVPNISVPLEDGVTTYEYVVNEELQAVVTVENAASSYPTGGVIKVTAEGRNGYGVRLLQTRNYYDDGSRSGVTTIPGNSATVIVDGDTKIRLITGKLYDYAIFPVASVIAPDNAADYEAGNLGANGSIPLSVFNEILATKVPQNLGGVIDFEEAIIGPNTFTGTEEIIEPETTVDFRQIRAELPDFSEIRISLNSDNHYVEAGGDNLATVDGPGPVRDTTQGWTFNGVNEGLAQLSYNPSGRVPSSGIAGLGGATAFAFDFSTDDKVVMAGLVYMSRANFQHGNPDNIDSLWAKATYSDGSTSDTLSSKNLKDVAGEYDNFFGFEAPAGLYISQIQVWCRGQNARAFTVIDDLAFVLEGDGTNTYDVAVSSNNEARGTVSAGGSFADGSTLSLTATPAEGFAFAGWTYANDTNMAIFSTDTTSDFVVTGPKEIVGLFVEPGFVSITDSTNAVPGISIPLEDGVNTYDYVVGDVVQATVTVTGAMSTYPNGGIVEINAEGQNGYGVRLIQTRNYYDDGSRSGVTTIPGNSAKVLVDGDTKIRLITGKLYEYAIFPVTDVIAPDNAADFQADNLGADGSIPLSAFNDILAVKVPLNLGGVIDFEDAIIGPNTFTGTEEIIEPETTVDFRQIRAELPDFSEIKIWLNPDNHYVEAGGDNLATVDGPGPVRDLTQGWTFNGKNEGLAQLSYNPSGRVPSSGIAALGGATAFAFDFSTADKVVMAGLVYMSRANFQHGNPDNIDSLWAKATYSDGSTSETLSSKNLKDVAGKYDNFFGFEAPVGLYISQIQVWCRGQNARAFTVIDDLAFVLEGPDTDTYEVTVDYDDSIGTVTGEPMVADGANASLEAVANSGSTFFGWYYVGAPYSPFSTASVFETPVHGPKALQAIFDEGLYGAYPSSVDLLGGTEDVSVWLYALPDNSWTATSESTWVSLPAEPVTGSGWLDLTVAPNLGNENRTAQVTIGDEVVVNIIQMPISGNLFPGATFLGGSNYEGSWLDTVFTVYGVDNQIFVGSADHGWWYVVPANGYIWVYDYSLGLPLAIIPENYPWIYSSDLGGWLYFYKGSTAPNRWFYDLTIGQWVNESAL